MTSPYAHMYKNQFKNLYDLHQDIIKYKQKTNEEIIYWSTFQKEDTIWYRSWKNKDSNKSWIFDPEGYDSEQGNWRYDLEKFGKKNFDFILDALVSRNYPLLTKVFNHPSILDLKAFL